MELVEDRIIHRFIRDISEYERGGEYFNQVIPADTQAYAIYSSGSKIGLYYVLGDDEHTYTEIRDGQGSKQSAKEYPVFSQDFINTINKKADKTYVDSEITNTKNTLNAAIEAETARATGAENAITVTINDETARAVLAEDNLNKKIEAETTRATSAEQTLTTNLNAEIERATNAEKQLNTTLTSHTNNKNNPHTVTKAQIGLGNCDNTSDANKPISTATQLALNTISDNLSEEITRAKKAEGELAADLALEAERATNAEQQINTNLASHINNKENPHVVTKAQIGLNNVDNTSDLNKPISTATQSALDSLSTEISNEVTRAKAIEEELSEDITSESLRATNAENTITSNLTAHTTNANNPHNVTKSQIGLSNVDNTADLNKPISTATQNALNNKADKAITLSGYGITDAYTKTEIDSKISSVYKFKGSVDTVEELPVDENTVGDVYNVTITGDNYAWTEEGWDKLAGDIDLTPYLLKSEAQTNYATISSLSTVATSGSYNDLLNKPTIPTTTNELTNNSGFITNQVSDLTNYTLTSDLADVALSGSYNDLLDLPNIPANTSDLTNDSGFITNNVNNLTNYTLTSSLSDVALSGNYEDLSNTPSIPTKVSDLNNDTGFITTPALATYALKTEIPANVSDLTNDSGYITNTVNNLTNYTLSSNLSTVATSGSYNDLKDKPTIPTEYVLPTASNTVLGGVKIDNDSIVISDGVISVSQAIKDLVQQLSFISSTLTTLTETVSNLDTRITALEQTNP